MPESAPDPLSSWRFEGRLRHYQADVLARVDVHGGRPLHIVAPPGSGKTLLGLMLAARRGRCAVVLAPTTTIRGQWVSSAVSLASAPDAVSDDPDDPRDLTVLTYQALSVLDDSSPLAGLADTRWCNELEADGRSPQAARAWLDELRSANPRAYRAGIARRSRTLRRALVREAPEVLEEALHPNARALIDRLVARGVETIVLDECHHLLDHWALVVAALAARIRAAGRTPLLIGLTATLPSPDDADQYDNYTSLLGDVDYEVPVPAVVREGNLAPYRDLALFVEPTTDELAFLRAHAEGLAVLIRATFAGDVGLDFVVAALQPAPDPEATRSPLDPPPAPVDELEALDGRLAAAFAADFAGAEAAAAMLATVAPQHPLVARLPDVARRPPTSHEALRLLARFALDRVLPDPALRELWENIRRTLADFGYSLSDRGVRRTRDPVDTLLASSLAKDFGVCEIVAFEREALGDDRLRVLVVADFAEHGNMHGGLIGAAGALRTFDVVTKDAATRGLRSMLVTGSSVRIASGHADALVPLLSDMLGVPVAAAPLVDEPGIAQVHAPGVTIGSFVRAASQLLTEGAVHLIVGTRGLFGEGWDCPAVNTLIDLTAVATASATQQLRGRTLRLDPAWSEKVAHNWTVTALLPSAFPLAAAPDAARLRRKHEGLWGLDRDDSAQVVRGLSTVLTAEQRERLRAVVRKDGTEVTAINELLELPPRSQTRADWRIGEQYVDREGVSMLVPRRRTEPVFRTSPPAARTLGMALTAVLALAVGGTAAASLVGPEAGISAGLVLGAGAVATGWPLGREWRRTRAHQTRSTETYRRIGQVVWRALRSAQRVSDTDAMVTVAEHSAPLAIDLRVPEATLEDQRTFAQALTQLFGPVRTPRFVLETGRGGQSWLVRAMLRRAGIGEQFVAVPTLIGRRTADAEAFAGDWEREVGPCVLHALDRPAALTVASRARRGGGADRPPLVLERWE